MFLLCKYKDYRVWIFRIFIKVRYVLYVFSYRIFIGRWKVEVGKLLEVISSLDFVWVSLVCGICYRKKGI